MEGKPPAPAKAAVQAPPSKPKGIKGWGRVRVGVGVPVKKEEASAGTAASLRPLLSSPCDPVWTLCLRVITNMCIDCWSIGRRALVWFHTATRLSVEFAYHLCSPLWCHFCDLPVVYCKESCLFVAECPHMSGCRFEVVTFGPREPLAGLRSPALPFLCGFSSKMIL